MGDKAPKTEKCVCGSWFVVDAYPDGHSCYPAQETKALKKQLAIAVEALQRLQGWRESDYSRDNPFDFMFEADFMFETALNALKQIEEMDNG